MTLLYKLSLTKYKTYGPKFCYTIQCHTSSIEEGFYLLLDSVIRAALRTQIQPGATTCTCTTTQVHAKERNFREVDDPDPDPDWAVELSG